MTLHGIYDMYRVFDNKCPMLGIKNSIVWWSLRAETKYINFKSIKISVLFHLFVKGQSFNFHNLMESDAAKAKFRKMMLTFINNYAVWS